MTDEEKRYGRFFVYGLLDSRSGDIRYVGKTSIGYTRPRMHCRPPSREVRTRTGCWLRRMWEDGEHLPAILVLKVCQSDAEALEQEVTLISFFRQVGVDLTNLTNGGEGQSGHVFSPERCAKISAALLGKKLSPEHLAKTRLINVGRKHPPEFGEAISKRLKGRVFSEETRIKMSCAATGRVMSAEAVAKTAAANRGKKHTPEHCAKIGEANRGVKRSEETIAKLRRPRSPLARARMRVAWEKRRAQEGYTPCNGHLHTPETLAKALATKAVKRKIRERAAQLIHLSRRLYHPVPLLSYLSSTQPE